MALIYAAEPLPGETGRGDTDPNSRRGRVRHLMRTHGVTGPQAKAMIAAADAQEASRSEFGVSLNRRGDLIQVRGKARQPWRVTSG